MVRPPYAQQSDSFSERLQVTRLSLYPLPKRPGVLKPPTRQAVRDSYENRWAGTHDQVAAAISNGERDLSRLVHGAPDKGWPTTPETEVLYDLIRSRLSIFRLRRDLAADQIIENLAPDTDAIIETGAGWGSNLFRVWLRGGPDVPYHCLELAETGRQTCELIARSAAAAPRMATAAFDFYQPDFSSVAGQYQHPLVFSCASIDKVNPLPASYIDDLLDIAPQVTVVSMEFLSWQLALEEGRTEDDAIAHVRGSGLNENFLPLLRRFESEGRIAVEETVPSILGPHVTYMRWSKLA